MVLWCDRATLYVEWKIATNGLNYSPKTAKCKLHTPEATRWPLSGMDCGQQIRGWLSPILPARVGAIRPFSTTHERMWQLTCWNGCTGIPAVNCESIRQNFRFPPSIRRGNTSWSFQNGWIFVFLLHFIWLSPMNFSHMTRVSNSSYLQMIFLGSCYLFLTFLKHSLF